MPKSVFGSVGNRCRRFKFGGAVGGGFGRANFCASHFGIKMLKFISSFGLLVENVAEGVGNAPTSVRTDPIFKTGAASLYLPAFQKLAARVGLAPTPHGLTGRRATLTLSGN